MPDINVGTMIGVDALVFNRYTERLLLTVALEAGEEKVHFLLLPLAGFTCSTCLCTLIVPTVHCTSHRRIGPLQMLILLKCSFPSPLQVDGLSLETKTCPSYIMWS